MDVAIRPRGAANYRKMNVIFLSVVFLHQMAPISTALFLVAMCMTTTEEFRCDEVQAKLRGDAPVVRQLQDITGERLAQTNVQLVECHFYARPTPKDAKYHLTPAILAEDVRGMRLVVDCQHGKDMPSIGPLDEIRGGWLV